MTAVHHADGEDNAIVGLVAEVVEEYRDRWNLGLAFLGFSKTKEYLHILAQPREVQKAFQFTYFLQGVLGVVLALSTRTSV